MPAPFNQQGEVAMRMSSVVVLSLLCLGVVRAEDKKELTADKAQLLLKEKRDVKWNNASLEAIAEDIQKATEINVMISVDLMKTVGTEAKTSAAAVSLGEALDIAAAMLGFTWFLDGTMLWLETEKEGAERVRVVKVDFKAYCKSAKSDKEVKAMTKEQAAAYEAALLAETKKHAEQMMEYFKEQGGIDENTSSLVARAGVIEIHGKQAFINTVIDALENGGATSAEMPR